MKFKVVRYLKGGKKQGEYHIHAYTIEQACALEGHNMNTTERAITDSIEHSSGRIAGWCFVQDFPNGLPENRRQYVDIEPVY